MRVTLNVVKSSMQWRIPVQKPRLWMVRETDVRVIFFGGGRGEQQDSGLRSAVKLSLADQFFSDAFLLMRNPNGEIRKIREIRKICNRARYTQQQISFPRGDDEICVLKHRGESWPVVYRPPRA